MYGWTTPSLRGWLLMLGIAGMLGATAIAAVAALDSWRARQERLDATLMATSRAITESIDRELDQAVAFAHALAISRDLAAGELLSFDVRAQKIVEPYGYTLVTRSLGARDQLVETPQSVGETVAVVPILAATSPGKDQVTIAPLQRSPSGEWLVSIQVPIVAGERRYRIDILVPAATFQRILNDQHLPKAWTPVLLDANWTIVARDPGREKFIGQKGGAQNFQHSPDAVHEVRLLEGDAARSAHTHSVRYGWTTALAAPDAESWREFIGPVFLVGVSGFGVAALAIGAVLVFSVFLARGISKLADATKAVGEGAVTLPRFRVRELALVGEGLQRAAAKIAEDKRSLEVRIADATSELRHQEEEKRKAEAALAHAQKLESLGQLTSGIAHDFNNLLAVILGSVEGIEQRAPNEHLLRLARQARQGAERGARLVKALLAFARKQPLRPEIANPNLLIKEFEPMLRDAAGDTVQLQLLLSPTLHPCRIDAAQFQSALLNLVINSGAAMPRGGRITIETRNVDLIPGDPPDPKSGSCVRISVSDTGEGMSPEIAYRAFEPFFTTKEPGKGSGLGLSQVYGFAKQSGGDVRLTSEQDVGTTVALYLPRSVEEEAQRADIKTSANAENVPIAATVMVVDDNAEVRAVLVEMVQELGCNVREESDGRKALDRIRSGERVDLMLTDYLMPHGMNGRDLAREVAAIDHTIKVLLISGNASSGDGKDTEIPILQKPISISVLRRAIRGALNI